MISLNISTSIKPQEAAALIAFFEVFTREEVSETAPFKPSPALNRLLSQGASAPLHVPPEFFGAPITTQAPATTTEVVSPEMAVEAEPELSTAKMAEAHQAQEAPAQAPSEIKDEAPKRKRRTKEEMAADAAAKAETASYVPNPDAKAQHEAPAVAAAHAPEVSNAAPTLEEVRAALKGYTAKHGMAAASELLGDFGIDRVSELASLPLDEQLNFMKLARNV